MDFLEEGYKGGKRGRSHYIHSGSKNGLREPVTCQWIFDYGVDRQARIDHIWQPSIIVIFDQDQ